MSKLQKLILQRAETHLDTVLHHYQDAMRDDAKQLGIAPEDLAQLVFNTRSKVRRKNALKVISASIESDLEAQFNNQTDLFTPVGTYHRLEDKDE